MKYFNKRLNRICVFDEKISMNNWLFIFYRKEAFASACKNKRLDFCFCFSFLFRFLSNSYFANRCSGSGSEWNPKPGSKFRSKFFEKLSFFLSILSNYFPFFLFETFSTQFFCANLSAWQRMFSFFSFFFKNCKKNSQFKLSNKVLKVSVNILKV